jgi:hypothetical protein
MLDFQILSSAMNGLHILRGRNPTRMCMSKTKVVKARTSIVGYYQIHRTMRLTTTSISFVHGEEGAMAASIHT